MQLAALDLAIRAATASVLMLAAIVFVRDGRSDAARFGAGLCLFAIVYLVADSMALEDRLFLSLGLAANLAIPLFWLFARAWFDDGFTPRRRDAALIAIFAALRIFHLGVAIPLGRPWLPLSGLASLTSGAAFVVHALWIAWRGRDDDLVEPRRRMRLVFVVGVGLFILWALGSEGYARTTGHFPQWKLVNAALLLVLVIGLAVALLTLRRADMFPSPAGAPPDPAPRPAGDPRLVAALDRLIADERIYRTDGLTIGALAARLDVPEYRLRQRINGALGFRNFNEYLNHHRLAEVRAALADPAQAAVPILTIALDAGFGSLAPFNRAFKAASGTTPREFRRAALGNSAAD